MSNPEEMTPEELATWIEFLGSINRILDITPLWVFQIVAVAICILILLTMLMPVFVFRINQKLDRLSVLADMDKKVDEICVASRNIARNTKDRRADDLITKVE